MFFLWHRECRGQRYSSGINIADNSSHHCHTMVPQLQKKQTIPSVTGKLCNASLSRLNRTAMIAVILSDMHMGIQEDFWPHEEFDSLWDSPKGSNRKLLFCAYEEAGYEDSLRQWCFSLQVSLCSREGLSVWKLQLMSISVDKLTDCLKWWAKFAANFRLQVWGISQLLKG